MPGKEKKPITSLEDRKKIFERRLEELELKNKLLGSPELFVNEKGSDEFLDILSLTIKLNGGIEFILEDYINENVAEYESHFYKGFFYQIAKLYGYPESVMDPYIKPFIAAYFIINFVYARFPERVFRRLTELTPWRKEKELRWVRIHKLFQRLSPIAIEQLDLFIDQAYVLAKESKDLTDFKLRFSEKYHTYFQIDMFIDVEIQ